MALKGLEYWVLAQVVLELILVLLLLIFLVKLRNLRKILGDSQGEEKVAVGSLAKLSEQLATLENRRVALEETLGLISEKAKTLKDQSPPPRPESLSSQPRGTSLRFQVEEMHLKGFSAAEIARRLGLHPAEVKMALDLARLKADQDGV